MDPSTCDSCGDTANVSVKRTIGETEHWHFMCYDCFYTYQDDEREAAQFKNLAQLVAALREHAYAYTFHDGRLVANLRQAANYLEAVANA